MYRGEQKHYILLAKTHEGNTQSGIDQAFYLHRRLDCAKDCPHHWLSDRVNSCSVLNVKISCLMILDFRAK